MHSIPQAAFSSPLVKECIVILMLCEPTENYLCSCSFFYLLIRHCRPKSILSLKCFMCYQAATLHTCSMISARVLWCCWKLSQVFCPAATPSHHPFWPFFQSPSFHVLQGLLWPWLPKWRTHCASLISQSLLWFLSPHHAFPGWVFIPLHSVRCWKNPHWNHALISP